MRRVLASVGVGLLLVAACAPAPTSSVVEVPPPLPTPPETAASPPKPLPQPLPPRRLAECEAPPSLAGCTALRRVRVGPIALSTAGCKIDARVHEGDVGTVFRCATGAVVRFPRATFAGDFHGSRVAVCTKTRFPFVHGCTWESMQRIVEGESGLVYTYGEYAVSGEGCSADACSARAVVRVEGP